MKTLTAFLLLLAFGAHAETSLPEENESSSVMAGFAHIPQVYDETMQAVVNPDTGELLCAENCQVFTGEGKTNISVDPDDSDPIFVERVKMDIVVYDYPNGKVYIYSDTDSKIEGTKGNTTVTSSTLLKYTKPNCPHVAHSHRKITAYVAIGDRVESFDGYSISVQQCCTLQIVID